MYRKIKSIWAPSATYKINKGLRQNRLSHLVYNTYATTTNQERSLSNRVSSLHVLSGCNYIMVLVTTQIDSSNVGVLVTKLLAVNIL